MACWNSLAETIFWQNNRTLSIQNLSQKWYLSLKPLDFYFFFFLIQKTVWKLQICLGNRNIFIWKFRYFFSSLEVISCLLHSADVFFLRQVFAPFWKSPLMFNAFHSHPSPAVAAMQWDVFSNCCVAVNGFHTPQVRPSSPTTSIMHAACLQDNFWMVLLKSLNCLIPCLGEPLKELQRFIIFEVQEGRNHFPLG